jgi:L-lactate dehydrogenase complex protein LldG
MSGERDKIFGRIREALSVAAPRHAHQGAASAAAHQSGATFRAWLPPVGETLESRLALFGSQCEVLKTEFVACADAAAAAAHLSALAEANEWKRLALHPGVLNDAIALHLPTSLEQLVVGPGYDKSFLETCDAGLTECESLVAQTGSICVTALSSGGRALSVLPPHHVAVARREQLVADLTEAYERLSAKYGPQGYPSFISFISGPSRTGDIERILVLGAHGPKKLTVLLVD